MARKSLVARQEKRKIIVEKFNEKRKKLKEKGDYVALQKLPRNASPTRLHNRCSITGRPRGYSQLFGLSRIVLRELACNGLIPGLTKASW
jgi:small subunit ribosomal protein S14